MSHAEGADLKTDHRGISSTEIPIGADGRTYHLPARGPIGDRQEVARHIILVGDPERVDIVAAHFDEVTYRASSREINVRTGRVGDLWVSVISTGMGPDNTEIVTTELYLLNEYDVATKQFRSPRPPPLVLLRLGTCGCPQADVPPASLAVTLFAIGIDNVGHFYPSPKHTDGEIAMAEYAISGALSHSPLGAPARHVTPYVAHAHPALAGAVADAARAISPERAAATVVGITLTAPGFYAPQGRRVGLLAPEAMVDVPAAAAVFHPSVPRAALAPSSLAALGAAGAGDAPQVQLRISNIEMEAAALLRFGAILGYPAGAVCAVVANRPVGGGTPHFATPEEKNAAIDDGVRAALGAFKHV